MLLARCPLKGAGGSAGGARAREPARCAEHSPAVSGAAGGRKSRPGRGTCAWPPVTLHRGTRWAAGLAGQRHGTMLAGDAAPVAQP